MKRMCESGLILKGPEIFCIYCIRKLWHCPRPSSPWRSPSVDRQQPSIRLEIQQITHGDEDVAFSH